MNPLFTIILSILIPLCTTGQDCDCRSSYDWLKKTFEENDAGYQYAVDQKGMDLYQAHNTKIENKIKATTEPTACAQILRDWLAFFRAGHIGLSYNGDSGTDATTEIKSKFSNWEKLDLSSDLARIQKSQKGYEGVWTSGPYEIGIVQKGDSYVGAIIQADNEYWEADQVKLKIDPDGSATYYMKDHSAEKFDSVQTLGEHILRFGFITLNRKEGIEPDPSIRRYITAMTAEQPYFIQLDSLTSYLRIPSFDWKQKRQIDSLVDTHLSKITSSPNLIIDLRYNGGGSDDSYASLIPLLYTNPIKTIGVEYRSTKLNNQRMKDIADGKFGEMGESEKKRFEGYYDKLSANLGEFVNLYKNPVSIETSDTTYAYPSHVGIIVNQGNGSTTEQFLLAARQSTKVKLFGTTTAGVLDISNMYQLESPCHDYTLSYCLTRSLRIPHMAIDGKGILPDYFINAYQFQDYDWIDYVRNTLSQ